MARATQDAGRSQTCSCTQLSCTLAELSRSFHSMDENLCASPTTPRLPEQARFGLFPFRSPLLGESLDYFLFLRVLRCFSSPRSPSPYEGECHVFNMTGCPIRKSADQRPFAPPRGFSQLITSFIASESQGIRHVPFFPFTSPRTGVPCGWIYFRLPPYRAGCLYCHTMS